MIYENNASDFEKIIRKYGSCIYRIALIHSGNKSDAQDIVQEIFLKYAEKNPDFNSEEHQKSWFIRVTLNMCKNLQKSAWNSKTSELTQINSPTAQFHQKTSDVYEAVQQLPYKYRNVIHLYYYEGYSVKEISNILDQNQNATKTQMSRARNMLKEILKGEYSYEI